MTSDADAGVKQGVRAQQHSSRGRDLTEGEWTALSPGLASALRSSGARPRIVARSHPAAWVAALWRGGAPILTHGDLIWWPTAPDDVSRPGGGRLMATLQHELQHVLDYREGALTVLGYLSQPRNWTYRWTIGEQTVWTSLGAEQRAAIVEHLWLAERGMAPPEHLSTIRRLVPWATT